MRKPRPELQTALDRLRSGDTLTWTLLWWAPEMPVPTRVVWTGTNDEPSGVLLRALHETGEVGVLSEWAREHPARKGMSVDRRVIGWTGIAA